MRRSKLSRRKAGAFLSPRHRLGAVAAAAALFVATLSPQAAQALPSPDDEPEPQGQSQGTTGGFAFGKPRGFFLVKAGLYLPREDSDIYTFNQEQLTLDPGDFKSGLFGIDFGWSVNDRVDVVFGFDYTSSSPVSESRDFVDEFGDPIVQQTTLRQAPLTASVRLNLVERGRSVGSYAWVANTAVPYVGGGGGITWWKYQQFGDFVDFFDFTIFTDRFETQGWDPILHVFGGVDVSLSPRFVLNFEARYSWAEGDMAPAFVGFEPIDLGGFRGTVGASFRF